MAAADNGSGPYYMSAGQYQLLAASQQQNALQYKRCNCKKAKCLKLYCVCFAAGVYCQNCNCLECSNLPEKSELVMAERQRVLQREPMAFTTKVMGPAHLRGCKCKRSRCVKKYCDCYDSQVRCSEMCKCKDCLNQPDNYNGGAAAAAATAAAAGAPSMSLALGPQHHAMLLAMQQQQQGAEYDPAALARLQLFGGAGFTAEGLEAAASGGGGGSQPASRAASPGLAAFLPAASQAFAAGAAAAALQGPLVPGLPQSAAAAAAAAAAVLQAAGQDLTLPQAPPLMHSQPQAYHLGGLQDAGHWQQMLLDHQQQHSVEAGEEQGMDHDAAAAAATAAATAAAAAAGASSRGPGAEQEDARAREHGAAEGGRVSSRVSDPGPTAGHLQLVVPAQTRRGSSAPVLHADSPSAAAAAPAAAAAAAAIAAAAAAGGGGMHRSASVGAEHPGMQERNPGVRAASLPPPDALPVSGLRPVRRSLQQQQQQQQQSSASGQGIVCALPAELQCGTASGYAAEAAAAELAHAPTAAAAAAGAASFYAPYRITKVEPLVYTGSHAGGLAAAGAAASGGVDDAAVDSQQQQQQYAQDAAGQEVPRMGGGEHAAAASMDQGAGSMLPQDDSGGLLYQDGQEGAAAAELEHAAAAGAAGEGPAAAAAAAAVEAAGRGEADHEAGPLQGAAMLAAAHNPEAAAAAAAALAGTAHESSADAAAAAAAALGLPGMLDDPTAAGVLAAKLGLCDNVQQAAVNAAKFLRDILNLSRLAAGPDQPTGSFTGSQQQPQLEDQAAPGDEQVPGSGTTTPHGGRHPATPAFSTGGVSATHDMHQQPQPGSRLRHSSSAAHAAAARPAGSLLAASASLGHWGTAHTPASKAAAAAAAAVGGPGGPLGSGMSPAMSAGSDMHHPQQPRQQHVVASTPQCGPPAGHGGGGASGAAAAAAVAGQGTGVTSAGSVSFAKSLGGGMYAPGAGGITPLPLAAVHAPGVRINSCLRGPSPLGPVGANRDGASSHSLLRETGGLQALMGPAARERQQHGQQQQQLAPTAEEPAGSGGGAPGSAARRSMQLLPGSFRLAASHNNSPGVGSPAVAAALAHSGALAGAADSPAGSVSLAPSIASAAPAAAGGHAGAAAEPQEQTPVYSNAQKQPCGLYDLDQQQQLDADMQIDGLQEGLMMHAGKALLPVDHTTPVPASSSAAALAAAAGAAALAAAAAGPVHTPLSAALEALGAAVSAPTPAAAQQQLQAAAAAAAAAGRGLADGADAAAAGVTNLFGSVPGGATNLQDMTPSSLFIASLLAANRTPTDMFLTSPLPPIGSALRQAGLGSAGPLSAMHTSTAQAAGAAGAPARPGAHGDCPAGVGAGMALRGGQVTPLSLHGLQHGAPHAVGGGGHRQATPGSADLGAAAARGAMAQRHGRGVRGGGLGVGALCTGILRGSAAEAASSADAAAWAREQQQQLEPAAAGSGLEAAAAAGVLGDGEAPGEQQEDATASGMKPDTDKAAARATAAATSPAPAAGVGSPLAAASYISTPRDAGLSRGRPLSAEEVAAAEAPGAKRQRLHSGGNTTPGGQQQQHGCGCGRAPGASLEQQQQPSPALFKPAPGSAAAAAAGAKVQDTRQEMDAAGCGEETAGAGDCPAMMHPPQQQQQRNRQHSGPSGHGALPHQGALSALQQLLQGPAAPAGGGQDAAAATAVPAVKVEPGAEGQVAPGLQQQQQLAADAAEQQQQEMMKSPPVPTQRPDTHEQGAGRDRSPSMESYAAADAMLALCVIKRFGAASAQQ